jgi:diguanylate cyclase (GGDEF)-like protein/PAS domain S-box-containing protein
MTLRAKTLLVIGLTLLGLLGLLYVTAQRILLAGFERLEANAMRQDVQRAQDALADDLARLNTTAGDYAGWDDTYAFAVGENPTYAEVNFSPETYSRLNLSLVAVVNTAGELVYGSGYDSAQGQLNALPTGLRAYLTPTSPLLQMASETDSQTGLLRAGAQTLLIAARPILTSNYTGPIHGTLILGRDLDSAEVDRLAQVTHLALMLAAYDSAPASAELQTAQAALAGDLSIYVRPLNMDTVAGYARLDDMNGQPAWLLRVEAPRAIYAEGRTSVAFFLVALLVSGLVFGALIWVLLERLVLARLARLSSSVQAIGARGGGASQVPVSGHDELSNVATAINGMLTAQEQAHAAVRASEEKFRKLAETSAAAIFITQGARVRYANSRAAALTGYAHSDLLNMPFQAVVPAAPGTLPPQLAAPVESDRTDQYEIQIVSPRGPGRWLEVTSGPIDYEGEPAAIATAYDITERKYAEEALQAANTQLMTLVTQLESRTRESSLLSQLSDLLQACPTAEESYGVIAKFFQQLLPSQGAALYLYRASRDKLEAVATAGPFAAGQPVQLFAPEACWAMRLGHTHSVAGPDAGLLCAHVAEAPPGGYLCVPIMARGDALGMLHLRLTAEGAAAPDSAERPQADWLRLAETVGERLALALANVNLREALSHQAVRDPLTGLFNRRYLHETLEREISRAARSEHSVAVIFLDIDHFKRFNDTHGHDAGDVLLRAVGQLLKNNLRVEDIACRYGGEEFLLIMPDTTLESARERADSLRLAVAGLRVKHYEATLEAVSISVGVAAFPIHGTTGERVIRAADKALYQAKANGRDNVQLAAA